METQAEAVMADRCGMNAQYQPRERPEPFAVRVIEMPIAPRQGDTITEIGGDARVWEVDTFERQGARWTIYPRRRR